MSGLFQPSPMCRLMLRNVRSLLVIAWRLATSPTNTSPAFEKATTDGVVRAPSALGMTTGSPPSSTETTELVVPRSIPTGLAMVALSLGDACGCQILSGPDASLRRAPFPAQPGGDKT